VTFQKRSDSARNAEKNEPKPWQKGAFHECLKRRIPDMPTRIHEVAAWQRHATRSATLRRQFDLLQARIKPEHLYPNLP
jgi:hypothetical protein